MIRTFLISAMFALLPLITMAQDTRSQAELDDRGYLQAFLEDNLSGLGRDIRITGFEGALSARASVEQITIADDDGIWLTLNQVGLGWSRSALLSGEIDISELSAEEIIFARPPKPTTTTPSAEASGFSLPELPVSIVIEQISSPRIVIGQEVLGQSATLSLQGQAQLSDGQGAAKITLSRVDGQEGQFKIDGRFDNTTRQLDLDLALTEAADGIASNLLNLPDNPALALGIKGSGPLSDFTADISLSSDGINRLAGQVEINENDRKEQQFRLALTGDIAPVFLPDYRAFFGDNISLNSTGRRQPDGGLILEQLQLSTKALTLSGQASISPQGWPTAFDLTGTLASDTGAPVLLPLSGAKTYVKSGDLRLSYDARRSEDWALDALLSDVMRPDATLKTAKIQGVGSLSPGTNGAAGFAKGDFDLTLQGLHLMDPALAKAIGSDVRGKLRLDWVEGAPVTLSDLNLTNGNTQLRGALELRDFGAGMVLETRPDLRVTTTDLSQFDTLIGQKIKGAVTLALSGQANLLGGSFDLRLTGEGRDLVLGQAQVDPLLSGATELDISAVRDSAGTRVPKLEIRSAQAHIQATATLKTGASKAQLSALIKDAAQVDPGLSGPLSLQGEAVQTGETWALDLTGTGPGGADLVLRGRIETEDGAATRASGTITGKLARLSALRGLTGQPLSGAIDLRAEGQLEVQSGAFELSLQGSGQNLGLGNVTLDPLLAGQSTLTLRAHRDAGAPVLLDQLELTTREVTLAATGESNAGDHMLRFEGRLRDLAIVADGVSGPATAKGTAKLQGDGWQLDVTGQGPNQAAFTAAGRIAADGSRGDLKLGGSVHLGLLNPMIRPRVLSGKANLDLALNGPLALSSLSGQISVANGQLVLPAYNLSLELRQASARLANGRAQIDALAQVASGGQITARGGLGLAAPFNADLELLARQVHLSDGNIYDTFVNGRANLTGPLTGGAIVRAALTLGATEIRIPEATPSAVPVMANLQHVNLPADVRQTLKDAGMIADPNAVPGGLVYPLDITIDAPSQIFVRGRGLDAELGGRLRITGTSADVVPQGRFELVRGRLDILGKRLELTTGQVGMQGSFDPMLYFVATSKAETADVSITVDGPASDPEVTFSSVPDRPQDEVLALLLFGRDITKISPLQALRMAAAVRTLAGKGGEGIIGKLRGSFALDDLDVSTDESGVTNVRAGKYISENIYTDVVVGSDGTSEVNLNLNLSPSLKARGSVNSTGESKLGIFFEKDY